MNNEEIKKSFCDKIRERRQLLGMTQKQLADAIGVNYRTISQYENGRCLPAITKIPALSKALGVSRIDELFHMSGDC